MYRQSQNSSHWYSLAHNGCMLELHTHVRGSDVRCFGDVISCLSGGRIRLLSCLLIKLTGFTLLGLDGRMYRLAFCTP